jgi:hypothetical protein
VKVFVYIQNYDICTYVKESEKLPIASGRWGLLEWKAFDSQTLVIICKTFNPSQGTFPVCSSKSKHAKAQMSDFLVTGPSSGSNVSGALNPSGVIKEKLKHIRSMYSYIISLALIHIIVFL